MEFIGLCIRVLFSLALSAVGSYGLAATSVSSSESGFLVKSLVYKDSDGDHRVEIFKRPTYSGADRAVIGYSLLVVDYIVLPDTRIELWRLVDGVSCAGLDFEVDYFYDHLSVTDLNGDGRMEVTVPYRIFCGGGVDSKSIKIIIKGRGLKFGARGESRLIFPNGESIGGEIQLDKSLDASENRPFKMHLLNVWKAIYTEKR